MNVTNHAPAGIDLDNDAADLFTAADLDEIEAIAVAAPQSWFGMYQIVDGISDEKAVALVEACSPDTVLTLISMARSGLARRAAEAVPATDVRHAFEMYMSNRGQAVNYEGDGLYAYRHVNDQSDAFKAGVEYALAQQSSHSTAAVVAGKGNQL
jgi:hypothetical protein